MHSPPPSILISEGPSSPTSRRSPHLNRAGPRIFHVNLLRRFSLPLRMVMRQPMPFLTAKVPARSISTSLYDLYTPFVTPFVRAITDKSFIPLIRSSPPHDHSLDVLSRLSGSAPRPPVSYLASAVVSFLVIGLTQLTQYLVAFKVTDITPSGMLARFSGATGHSQDTIFAVAISTLKWLFLAGLCA